jgi:hypothetical protein
VLPTHHAGDINGNDGEQCVDKEQQNENGVSHAIGLALTERFRATGSAEDAAGNVRKDLGHVIPPCSETSK